MFMCTDKYNTHINFKEFLYLIGLVMRLRHKKPLNPYKGQTNNDKSEFNDDDFNQQGSPVKRTATSANDQVFKYARILTKFIKTVNQNYKLYAAQEHPYPAISTHNQREQPQLNDSENQRENTPLKSQQINQRKQKLKLQFKKQVKQPKREQKLQTRKKDIVQGQLTNQQNKPKPTEHSPANSIEPSKLNPFSKSNLENIDKSDKNGNTTKNQPSNQTQIGMNSFSAQNGGMSMHNIKTDANAALSPNNIQNNIQAYLSYVNLFGQNQLLPNMYAGMQGMPMQMGQLPMNMMQGYMPNMQMGFNSKLFGMNSSLLAQAQQQSKPCQNLFSEQAKLYNINKQSGDKSKNFKEVFPLKRSAFHVAIAYKIYLDKLKKEGKSFDNLEEIDPTRNARRVKSGQGSNKGKEAIKKKK